MMQIFGVCLILLLVGHQLIGDPLTLIRKIPHSGYSEGLDFYQGYLWNALPNEIAKINPKDGSVVARFQPATAYSESIVWVKDVLWNVSFSDNGIYQGSLHKGKLTFKNTATTPEVHAWGIVFDGKHLVVTGDNSNKLYFLNPRTLKVERTITVSVTGLEDLAWDGKGLWSSSFTEHRGKVFRIDPKTGSISNFYDLPNPEDCPVIDGIATENGTLWITGKHCPSLYQVKNPLG